MALKSCRTIAGNWTWCLDPLHSLELLPEWKLVSSPMTTPVEEKTKQVFRDRLARRLREAGTSHHEWFLNEEDGVPPESIFNFDVSSPPLQQILFDFADSPPTAPSQPHQRVTRRVVYHSTPFVPISKIAFELISADFPEAHNQKHLTLAKIRSEMGFAVEPGDESTDVLIWISDQDIRSGKADTEALNEAKRLIVDASEAVRKHTLLRVGEQQDVLGDQSIQNTVEEKLQSIRNLPAPAVIRAFSVSADPSDDGGAVISIRDVHYVHEVVIEGGDSSKTEAIAALQRHYVEKFKCELQGRIPRGEAVGRAMYELTQDEYVAAEPQPIAQFSGSTLLFGVNTRDVIKKLTITPGASYSAEAGFSVNAAFTAENLTGRSESWSAAVAGGPNIIDTAVGWQLPEAAQPYDAWHPHFLGSGINGGYAFNNKKHFGTSGLTTDRLSSISGQLMYAVDSFGLLDHFYAYDVSAPKRKRARHLFALKPAFEISFLNADSPQVARSEQEGQISYVSIAPSYRFAYDLEPSQGTRGFHDITFENNLLVGIAGRHLGGDFSYDTIEASGTIETHFGFKDTRELFVRGIAGATTVSSGVPLQRQLQPGGGDYVRGLERGEVLARSVLWQQLITGMSFSGIWKRIHRQQQSHPGSDNSGPKLPFDPNESYVTLFLDHAWSGNSTSFSRTLTSGKSLKGFGIAAELDRLQGKFDFTIGYAFSPQSELHQKGLVFTSIKFRL
jgi:hypothetical protein